MGFKNGNFSEFWKLACWYRLFWYPFGFLQDLSLGEGQRYVWDSCLRACFSRPQRWLTSLYRNRRWERQQQPRRQKPPLLCEAQSTTALPANRPAAMELHGGKTCAWDALSGLALWNSWGTGRPSCRRPNCVRYRQEKQYTNMCMCVYVCCGVIIWAKFGLLRCYYLGQVCFLQNTVCQKAL